MPRYYAVFQATDRIFTSGEEQIARPEAAVAYAGPHKSKADYHVARIEEEGKLVKLAQIDADEDGIQEAVEDRRRKQTDEWRAA